MSVQEWREVFLRCLDQSPDAEELDPEALEDMDALELEAQSAFSDSLNSR